MPIILSLSLSLTHTHLAVPSYDPQFFEDEDKTSLSGVLHVASSEKIRSAHKFIDDLTVVGGQGTNLYEALMTGLTLASPGGTKFIPAGVSCSNVGDSAMNLNNTYRGTKFTCFTCAKVKILTLCEHKTTRNGRP